jgi:superfamily I DNA/RNA helicase
MLGKEMNLSARKARQLLAKISARKRSPAEEEDAEFDAIAANYTKTLQAGKLLDYDDLLMRPSELLAANSGLAASYRRRFQWIFVDEFQDVDALQYRLLKLLAPASGNICAIGDPDQAIYGFRGGDVGFFLRFEDDFPGTEIIDLKRNYRSAQLILDASSQMIAETSLVPERALVASFENAHRIDIHQAANERSEAGFIVRAIEGAIGGTSLLSSSASDKPQYSFSDFAVLYRTDAQAETLVDALARSGMPFQKRSHSRLLESELAQRILEMMRSRRGESSPAEALKEALSQVRAVHGLLRPEDPDQPEEARSPEKLELELSQIGLLLGAAAERFPREWDDFLTELSLGVETDLWDPRADRISLLTLHASKGLEFPVVFITGCEDGLLPLRWGADDEVNLPEERRLLYVGMTRAKDRLFLTYAGERLWRGARREMRKSPFLAPIEGALLELSRSPVREKPASGAAQLSLF